MFLLVPRQAALCLYVLSTLSQTLNSTSPPRIWLFNRLQLSAHSPLSPPQQFCACVPMRLSAPASTPCKHVCQTFCHNWDKPPQLDFLFLNFFLPVTSDPVREFSCPLKFTNPQFFVEWIVPRMKKIFHGLGYQTLSHLYEIQYAVLYWFYFQKVISWPAIDYPGDNRRHLLDTNDICQIPVCKAKQSESMRRIWRDSHQRSLTREK